MREGRQDHLQTFDGSFWAPGQIDDQGGFPDPADGTRYHGMGCFPHAFCSHGLGKTGDIFFDDVQRGIGRDIARAQTGSSGRENEIEAHVINRVDESPFNLIHLVRDDSVIDDAERRSVEAFSDNLAAPIFSFASMAFVAYRDDRCVEDHVTRSTTRKGTGTPRAIHLSGVSGRSLGSSSMTLMVSPTATDPPDKTLAKMPSVGMMHVPV